MADFQLNRLYDVQFDIVEYHQTTQMPPKLDNKYQNPLMTSTGQYINRHVTRMNKVLSFWFYQKDSNYKTYDSLINTVNNSQITIGQYTIDAKKGLLKNIQRYKVPVLLQKNSGQPVKEAIYKVFMQIQIQMQKPVAYQEIPVMGYYFKDSDGNIKRIQKLTNTEGAQNLQKYGYGFFSQFRHDLDVPYKMFLNEEGGIAFTADKVSIVKYTLHKQENWGNLKIPSKQGVNKYG